MSTHLKALTVEINCVVMFKCDICQVVKQGSGPTVRRPASDLDFTGVAVSPDLMPIGWASHGSNWHCCPECEEKS